MDDGALPAFGRMTPEWVDFFIMAGAVLLVAMGAIIWVCYFRKSGRKHRRKRRRHHEHRTINPTLAETGGLPPPRSLPEPPAPPPKTP